VFFAERSQLDRNVRWKLQGRYKERIMRNIYSGILFSITVLGIVVFSAVCWHSIDEIHYLKSFFPKQFNMQEAYFATAIELIKVIIIGMPIVLVICVSLYFWRHKNKE